MTISVVVVAALMTTVTVHRAPAQLDIRRNAIWVDAIVSGGPPKDGIPAVLSPRFRADVRVEVMAVESRRRPPGETGCCIWS